MKSRRRFLPERHTQLGLDDETDEKWTKKFYFYPKKNVFLREKKMDKREKLWIILKEDPNKNDGKSLDKEKQKLNRE